MPAEWVVSIVVSIFTVYGDIMNCSWYGAVKFLGHGVKVVEKRFHRMVSVGEMQFGLMTERNN